MTASRPRLRALLVVAVCASLASLSQAGYPARVSAASSGPAALPLTRSAVAARLPADLSSAAPRPFAPSSGQVPSAPGARAAHGVSLAGLSAQQLAGQRVIYSYEGRTPPASLLEKIRSGEAAGVIFFRGNIASPAQIRGVINELQRANEASPVRAPLLMLTDQEGGLVRRLPGAPAASQRWIGQSADSLSLAREAGTAAGQNLRGVGMNVNLAPVLDVYRSAGDFIDQFQRSYASTPWQVAQLGSAFIAAQQRAGVATTAKHFPGLGAAAAAQNTDLRPVTLHVSLQSLRGEDEAPYPSAIAAGVRLVMVSWAVYPALDARRPAGLSPAVLQNELRQRLTFRGVTVTDALEAGALGAFGPIPSRGVLAAGAGMDLLLFSGQNVNEGIGGLNALASALRRGKLGRAAFISSVGRVIALRTSLGP